MYYFFKSSGNMLRAYIEYIVKNGNMMVTCAKLSETNV